MDGILKSAHICQSREKAVVDMPYCRGAQLQ